MKFLYPEGATPYNQDDKNALLPSHIATQKELNEWEEANILKAQRWLFSHKHSLLLTSDFMLKLHLKMFNETWKWAGEWRRHNTNIGVDWTQISSQISMLLGDVKYWTQNQSFIHDEIAALFHHRLVQIHPFSNGNGRFSRLITDALLVQLGEKRFSWGRSNLTEPTETRKRYIQALRAADSLDYKPLFEFVRS